MKTMTANEKELLEIIQTAENPEKAIEKARESELYMQKYCGCIFSEEDRYRKKK